MYTARHRVNFKDLAIFVFNIFLYSWDPRDGEVPSRLHTLVITFDLSVNTVDGQIYAQFTHKFGLLQYIFFGFLTMEGYDNVNMIILFR